MNNVYIALFGLVLGFFSIRFVNKLDHQGLRERFLAWFVIMPCCGIVVVEVPVVTRHDDIAVILSLGGCILGVAVWAIVELIRFDHRNHSPTVEYKKREWYG